MRLQEEAKSKKDVPRPCRNRGGGLIGSFQRYDPHPLEDGSGED